MWKYLVTGKRSKRCHCDLWCVWPWTPVICAGRMRHNTCWVEPNQFWAFTTRLPRGYYGLESTSVASFVSHEVQHHSSGVSVGDLRLPSESPIVTHEKCILIHMPNSDHNSDPPWRQHHDSVYFPSEAKHNQALLHI